MERTLAWLSKCCPILIRWDKQAGNELGLLRVGLRVRCFRRYRRLAGLDGH